MTLRSEGQFNTVVYEDEDVYRGIDRRDVILLHPDDLARFGLRMASRVTVTARPARCATSARRPFAKIKPGNAAMYYPECNVLVPRSSDPRSRTPAFKSIPITIQAEPTARLPILATASASGQPRAWRESDSSDRLTGSLWRPRLSCRPIVRSLRTRSPKAPG